MKKLMKWVVPALLMAAVAGSAQANPKRNTSLDAGGIGVGNGGNSAREAYVERLKREMGKPIVDRRASLEELSAWCHRASSLLNRELRRARQQLQDDRLEFSWQILQDALFAVARSIQVDPEFGGPLTKVLVDRGLLISRYLDESLTSGTRQEMASKLSFLFDYVQFVVEMEYEFDGEWYVPYRYRYRGCGDCDNDFRFAEFEKRFLDYGRKQLEFVSYTLTERFEKLGETEVRPIGDPRVFLKVAELTSTWVANDISNNLHAYRRACTITQLSQLATDLRDFNVYNDRTIFRNQRQAVYFAFYGMTEAASQLNEDPNSCWNRN